MLAWAAWGAQWELGHKVVFDGENRLIIVPPDVTVLNFKEDVYSDWKEWIRLYDYAEFLQAMRTTGGDPIGGGQFTGDYYFLINGWRMLLQGELQLEGNVFSDDYPSPFVTAGNTALVQNKVSALAIQIDTGGGTGGGSDVIVSDLPPANPTEGMLWWNSTTGILMVYYCDIDSCQWVAASPTPAADCPTAAEIVAEMDATSTRLANIDATTTDTNILVSSLLDGSPSSFESLVATVNTINTTTQNTQITVNDIQGTVNDIETAITTGAFPTLQSIVDGVWNAALSAYTNTGSAGFIVSTILGTVIDSKTRSDEIKIVVDNLLILVDEVLKYDRNRTRIDKTAKTLTVYDDDGVTPIRIFNLLDGLGAPSVEEVCERDPGPYAPPPPSTPIIFDSEFGPEFE